MGASSVTKEGGVRSILNSAPSRGVFGLCNPFLCDVRDERRVKGAAFCERSPRKRGRNDQTTLLIS